MSKAAKAAEEIAELLKINFAIYDEDNEKEMAEIIERHIQEELQTANEVIEELNEQMKIIVPVGNRVMAENGELIAQLDAATAEIARLRVMADRFAGLSEKMIETVDTAALVAENERLREAMDAQVEYLDRNGLCWCSPVYAEDRTDNEHAAYCQMARAALEKVEVK